MVSAIRWSGAMLLAACLGCVSGSTQQGGTPPGASIPAAPDAACEPVDAAPEAAGMDASGLQGIDKAVTDAIAAGELPGAVVVVARHGKVVYRKAFGMRAVAPAPEAMTVDTIFDIASLSKVVATTPAVMQLAERGAVDLNAPVKRYLPRFAGGGKDAITVRQLLTHYSGLRPDFDLSVEWSGYDAAIGELYKEKVVAEPGRKFAYSDLNFIALAEIVRVVSGQRLDAYAEEHIFAPLGMDETAFTPPAAWRDRTAPTEPRKNTLKYLKGKSTLPEYDAILRGDVHDATTWRMDGVSGHAGVFSTARDLTLYAQALLDRGAFCRDCGGARVDGRLMSEASFAAMTSPQSPAGAAQVRGYGWDIASTYASPRGNLPEGGFGHTGFTGTSIWIHPPSDSFIIILSNRVHPAGGKNINRLRSAVANAVAAAMR
ncbi:MAG: beta-lactamase family protein [Acidobacteriota bacterium]|jgi:CubicO group peptidase (beta-lactamase class C family)|nr:beta-lactamase family protein [Acidobacteriota bacterium]